MRRRLELRQRKGGLHSHESDLETILDLGDDRVGGEEVEELTSPGEWKRNLNDGEIREECQYL